MTWYHQQDKNLYIIGGGQIFSTFEHEIDEIIKTEIHASLVGDTYFPEDFDLKNFREVSNHFHPKDEKNEYDFTVKILERKGS